MWEHLYKFTRIELSPLTRLETSALYRERSSAGKYPSGRPEAPDIGQVTEQKQSDRSEISGLRGYAYILQDKAK